jgi:putative transposase
MTFTIKATSCANRIARLAKLAGIKAQVAYRRRPGSHGGKPSVVVDTPVPNSLMSMYRTGRWATDIAYIRTSEGPPYLAVLIDFRRENDHWIVLLLLNLPPP